MLTFCNLVVRIPTLIHCTHSGDEMTDISLVLLATDELDAGSTLEVQVKMVYDL